MKLMTLEFPLSRDIMTTVRLVTGGVCSLVGFDLESAEDCKVCVTESLLLLLHGGCKTATIEFSKGTALSVLISGEGNGQDGEEMEEEISVALLRALVSDLEMTREGSLTRISFGFGL